jgi:hypothetical protein
MPQSDIGIALRTLDFEKPFPTDPWKINNLTQTDQEVGGSNPPSCTKHLAPPVRNLSETCPKFCPKCQFHGAFFFTWRCATRCFATRREVSTDGAM